MKEKDNRPVYLNILTINLPIIGISSILHRVSGFALFLTFLALVWMLDRSLTSEEEFVQLLDDLRNNFSLKILIFLISVSVFYHSLVGIKKLISDFFGVGEQLKSGSIIAWIYNVGFAVISIITLIYIFFWDERNIRFWNQGLLNHKNKFSDSSWLFLIYHHFHNYQFSLEFSIMEWIVWEYIVKSIHLFISFFLCSTYLDRNLGNRKWLFNCQQIRLIGKSHLQDLQNSLCWHNSDYAFLGVKNYLVKDYESRWNHKG